MLEQGLAGLVFLVLSIGIILIARFVSLFRIRKEYFALFLFPLIIFVIGFSMRLTGTKQIIDLGFFFTDFSLLFVYLLFAIALILGQLKYWKLDKSSI